MERFVHVVPLGWERERAVGPIADAKAHKVYLLRRRDHERTAKFAKVVREDLEPIVGKTNIVELDILENYIFESVLMHVARVIHDETAVGNRVYVNMSAAGKVDAAAATLAAMYHSERLGGIYYAQTKDYAIDTAHPKRTFETHGLSVEYTGTIDLPRFRMHKPRDVAVQALAVLYEDGPSSLVHVVRRLKDSKVEPFVDAQVWEAPEGDEWLERARETNKWAQRFRRTALNELRTLNLVRQLPRGTRGQVKLALTKDGEYHALISGLIGSLRTSADVPPAAPRSSRRSH